MTPEYVEYRPTTDGVPPKYWRKGMLASHGSIPWSAADRDWRPSWYEGQLYLVPYEAAHGPQDTDSTEFDVAAWLAEGLANRDQLPEGVVLPEPVDPHVELWAQLCEVRNFPERADAIRSGYPCRDDKAAIVLLRERVVLKEGV